MREIQILEDFLSFAVESSDPVLERFSELPGAIVREGGKGQRFVYVPGRRKDRVVLVAHADTVWTSWEERSGEPRRQGLIQENGVYRSGSHSIGIGADDRAGCAILWLLKDVGHSLLVTDAEEFGRRGSEFLMNSCPDIADELNGTHGFMVQFDRRNAFDFKCYAVGTDAFREYVHAMTGFTEPDRSSCTDICTLCRDICGVNLSVGYTSEHSSQESLNVQAWLNTLDVSRRWLGSADLPRFPLTD